MGSKERQMKVIAVTRKLNEDLQMKRCEVVTVDATVLVLIVTLLLCGCGSSGTPTRMADASRDLGDAVADVVASPDVVDVNDLGIDVLVPIDAPDVTDIAGEDVTDVPNADARDLPPTVQASLAVGFDHTCARMMDGTARCWGGNGSGQLGDGTTINRLTAVATVALGSVASVAAGALFSCAKLTDRTVRCWGRNDAGQLGDGTMTDRPTPAVVGGLSSVTQLVVGGSHACALLADGTVRCWGYNGTGALGDGTTMNRVTPVAVTGLSGVTSISAGHAHTCARLADGTARCWGWNAPFQQLGDGTMTDRLTPVAVSGLIGAASVAGGYHHTCARLNDGRAVCWGDNSGGMVGDGTTMNRPTPVVVLGLTGAVDVGAGFDYSCALLADRTIRCWGDNASGALGVGTTEGHTAPVMVAGLRDVVSIAVGPESDHTCARLAGGAILCWGGNSSGQLGDGTTTSRTTPTAVVAGTPPTDAGTPTDAQPMDALGSMDSSVVCASGSSTCPLGTSARQVCNVDGRGFTSVPCVAPANATMPTCGAGGACTFTCLASFHRVGTACIADGATPRPITPLSLGDTSLRSPTLRWVLPLGMDGAVVELCRDRACAMVIETLRVSGVSARPSSPLPAGAIVYWRLRGRVGDAEDTANGPTWLFHTPVRDNGSGIDTSFNPHLDVNGDGLDDVVIGAPQAAPSGRREAGIASLFLGSASGVPAVPDRVFEGVAAGDRFGESVASAGDVNGDGFGDIVIGGAPFAGDPSRRSPGSASVFHGSAIGVSAVPARVLEGVAVGDSFGTSVASAGDVNRDGFADILIGSPGADPSRYIDAGTVSLFHGSAMGVGGTPAGVLEGELPGDGFGTSVAGAGDVNGDGFGDVLVGAPYAERASDPAGNIDVGSASVFHGDLAGIAVGATPSRRLEGVAGGDHLGNSVATAGDLNNDGYSDIIVGAQGADPSGRVDAGSARVYHGSSVGVVGFAVRVYEGRAEYDYCGHSVASAGDVNRDGFSDIAIGAPYSDLPVRTPGRVTVYHGGSSGTGTVPARELEGVVGGDEFGWSVVGAGDVNGDGFADILVGAPSASPGGRSIAGTASVFNGTSTGVATIPSRVLEGAAVGDIFGSSVASFWEGVSVPLSPGARAHRERVPILRRCLRELGRPARSSMTRRLVAPRRG